MRFLLVASLADSLINFRGPLIKELQMRGIDVHVAAPYSSSESSTIKELHDMGVSTYNLYLCRAGLNPLIDLRTFFSLLFLICRVRPHFFLGYTIKPVIYGNLASLLMGVPCRYTLITGLGYAFTGQVKGMRKFIRYLVMVLYRFVLLFSTKVFFQNPDDKELFFNLGLLRPLTPVAVVNGSGIDIDRFVFDTIPIGPPHFLFIGRLLGDKGVREFASAAMYIKSIFPLVQFTIVGWIDENPDSIGKNELKKWVDSGSINYLGRLRDVRPVIANCSVYVLPSYREGTPRTVLEAMAMGRPIITTDAPGCRETVIDGDNGFLVPVQSTNALVQAMKRFINDPALAQKMGLSSRKIVEEKYDVHKVNAVMLSEMGIL